MDVKAKLKEVKDKHANITSELEKVQERATLLNDEVKRLQGEYRLIVEIGIAQGDLNENGEPVDEAKKGGSGEPEPPSSTSKKKKD